MLSDRSPELTHLVLKVRIIWSVAPHFPHPSSGYYLNYYLFCLRYSTGWIVGWMDRWMDGWTDGGNGRMDGWCIQNVSWSNPPLVWALLYIRPACSPAPTSTLSTRLMGHQNGTGQLPVLWSTVCLQLEHRAENSGIQSQGLSRTAQLYKAYVVE